MSSLSNALLTELPGLSAPWLALGVYPTPVEHIAALGDVWVKREDASSPVYGGNKVRTLEFALAGARERGLSRVWALGAYGSNHTVAAILHGRRVGMDVRALLFPQPPTPTAAENLRATLSYADETVALRSIATFPLRIAARILRGGSYVMPPGAAVPLGAFGHAAAAVELAHQVKAGILPPPAHIVLAVGSTCTTSGLLCGLLLARHLGLWAGKLPRVHSVRVTPWPVTARFRMLGLARRTLAELARRGGPDLRSDSASLGAMLDIYGRFLGRGYGKPTRAGLAAAEQFGRHGGPPLDTTYASKSGAALLELLPQFSGPVVFWSTKSSVPLPAVDDASIAAAPAFLRRWLARADNWRPRPLP